MDQPILQPPGWYDDGSGHQRWWDGAAWGPYARAVAPTAPSAPKSPGQWPWLLGLGCLLIIVAGAAIGAVVGLAGGDTEGGTGTSAAPERTPEEVFLAWDESFREGDCELFRETTTEKFRDDYSDEYDYDDCDGFEDGLESIVDDKPRDFWETYEVDVLDVREGDDTATIEVEETWEYYADSHGDEIDTRRETYTYELVLIDGAWCIDDASFIGAEDEIDS